MSAPVLWVYEIGHNDISTYMVSAASIEEAVAKWRSIRDAIRAALENERGPDPWRYSDPDVAASDEREPVIVKRLYRVYPSDGGKP